MAMDGDCGNTTSMTMESTMPTSASDRNDSSMWQSYERDNWPNGVLVLSTKRNPQLCFPVDDTRSLTQWCVSIIKQTESLHKFPSWSDHVNASVVCWYPHTINQTVRQAYRHAYNQSHMQRISGWLQQSHIQSSMHAVSQLCIRPVNQSVIYECYSNRL